MTIANQEQAEHWNSTDEADHWVNHQNRYDTQLEPFARMILDAARFQPGESVLDVGCGCGATTLAAAEAVAPGRVVGLDLSVPMLARARERARDRALDNVTFVEGDAQVHPLDPHGFDVVISRFGVMFFSDPVAAFANLRAATKDGGRLAMVCWQAMIENEWLFVPGAAVMEIVPLPDLGPPDGPGMFALADADRVTGLLTKAGWSDVTLTSMRTPMLIGGGGTMEDTLEFLRTGAIGRTMMQNADEATKERALEALRAALTPFLVAEGVKMSSAAWVVQANA